MTVEEIKMVVWDCDSQKASGPDGFSFMFLKTYWDLLKDDVLEAVRHAFDSFTIPKGANSSFITLILKRRWIQMCLHSAQASVLVNGVHSCEFLIKCGLRQGDPLSPFLFIIVMEGLHLALKDAVSNGLIRGLKVRDTGLNISHLFYPDDVVILSNWNKQDMDNIINILYVFYLASRLNINISKSHVSGLGVSSNDTENMALDTGCSSGNIPFCYLGLPIGSNMNLLINWHHLNHRFRAKLSSWKANLLSIGGCLTLIKAMLRKDGMSIRFWKDNWDGNGPLCFRYNRLYHLDSNANCLLVDRFPNDTWVWRWKKQNIGGRNVAALDVMVSEIGHVSFNNYPDAWSWKISDNDSFSVHVTRSHIGNCLLPSLSPSSRWYKLIPRKALSCPPSPLVLTGYNGSRIRELQKNLKTVCMSSQRLLYGFYGDAWSLNGCGLRICYLRSPGSEEE
nr:putative RNA-directed DNA polymerase, eukaryota, reverse transcriptase zinc-binding domain protein [Tanacetum cinerariifolium]